MKGSSYVQSQRTAVCGGIVSYHAAIAKMVEHLAATDQICLERRAGRRNSLRGGHGGSARRRLFRHRGENRVCLSREMRGAAISVHAD